LDRNLAHHEPEVLMVRRGSFTRIVLASSKCVKAVGWVGVREVSR
jgi:hypothetical protein